MYKIEKITGNKGKGCNQVHSIHKNDRNSFN